MGCTHTHIERAKRQGHCRGSVRIDWYSRIAFYIAVRRLSGPLISFLTNDLSVKWQSFLNILSRIRRIMFTCLSSHAYPIRKTYQIEPLAYLKFRRVRPLIAFSSNSPVVCFPDFPFHQILPSMWFQGGDSEIFLWARDMTLEADLKTKKHADSYKKIDGWFEQKSLQAEIFRGSKLWYARTWEGLVESVVFTLFWAMVRLPQCRCAWTRSWSPAEFLNRQLWDVKLS